MQIIDFHCHIYPDKIAEKATLATGQFYHAGQPKGKGTVSDLLQRCDQAGIARAVVHSVATKPAQVRSINEFIASVTAESGGRLIGFGTLHPDSEQLEADVENLLELGLHGVKLHPDIQRFALNEPRSQRIFEICRSRLLFLIHAGDCRYQYSNPPQLVPVLEQFPDTTVIAAHLGGYTVWQMAADALCRRYDNLYVDCSSSLFAMLPEEGAALIRRYGAERVLFGTDYPMWDPQEEVKRFLALPLTDRELEQVAHQTAERLLER